MEEMRKDSINQFLTAFSGQLTQTQHEQYPEIQETIGDFRKVNGPLLDTEQFAVAKLTPTRTISGLTLNINKFSLWMQSVPTATDYTVEIYSDRDLENTVDTVVINVDPKGETSKKICLPLCDNQGAVTYYFVYDRQGNNPKNSKWNCNCSNSKNNWELFLAGGGCFVNDISELVDLSCNTEYSNGLQFEGSIECDGLVFLCGTNIQSKYGMHVARAIQLIFRRTASAFILNSPFLDAHKLLNTQEFYANRLGWYDEQINWSIQWLSQEYRSTYSDCFLCNDGPDFTMEKIII